MFHCPTCCKTVFLSECPDCGSVECEADEIAEGFVKFLRVGECPKSEPEPPAPFRRRLAAFVRREESDVMLRQPRKSTMPLHIFAPIGPYIGPKSRWFIKLLLTRIQYLVRGSN